MSFLAARNPALEPPPKPRFSGRARTVTSGKFFRRKSALPSVEPLSTTRISLAGFPASAARMLGMYLASRSFPFQLGMTTVVAVLACLVFSALTSASLRLCGESNSALVTGFPELGASLPPRRVKS